MNFTFEAQVSQKGTCMETLPPMGLVHNISGLLFLHCCTIYEVATSLLVKSGQCQAVGGGVACIVLQIIYSSRQSIIYNLQINKL